jgi:mono/diheme cytochrome c family protein
MVSKFHFLIFSCFLLAFMVACGSNPTPTPSTAEVGLERPEPPAIYSEKTNTLLPSDENKNSGKELYVKYCSTCHGEEGKGDGPAAASLDPKPEKLNENQAILSDAYLYWRIAEGGSMEPFKSGMPPWKAILSEEQIYQIITFLRTLE